MASRDIHLYFELHLCRNWQHPEDLFEGIKLAVDLAHLIPLENNTVENPNPQPDKLVFAPPVVRDLKVWFDQNYRFRETWDEKKFERLSPKEHIGGFFRTPLKEAWVTQETIWEHTIDIQVSAESFGEVYNVVAFSCSLYGKTLVLPEAPDTLHQLDEVIGLYQKFTRPIINQLKPEYALITTNHYFETYGLDILKAKLKFIHWINYFGPFYLQKYGEEIFMTAPGWRVKRLGEGIWYQLTEHFLDSKDKSLREQVLAHFKPVGVKAVS